jgi:hypothetical protein
MYSSFKSRKSIPRREHAIAGAVAGAVAAAAYAAEQELDLRAFRHNADDLILIGGLFTQDRNRARLLGLPVHLFNGAALGAGYAVFACNRLPGPPVVRGVAFGLAETVLLYPFAFFQDRHPAIRNGMLSRYVNKRAFAQSLVRHVVFGAVLGLFTERLVGR